MARVTMIVTLYGYDPPYIPRKLQLDIQFDSLKNYIQLSYAIEFRRFLPKQINQMLRNLYITNLILNYILSQNELRKSQIYKFLIIKERMDQAQIDALLKDSMFEDSSIGQSRAYQPSKVLSKEDQFDDYNDEFESYDQSRRTNNKNGSKTDLEESRKPTKKKLDQIKQQTATPAFRDENNAKTFQNKHKPKSTIYFEAKKPNPASKSIQRKNLPYNYARISEREKELLLTSLSEENQHLKETLKTRDGQLKKLDGAYKVLLQEKCQNMPSVRQNTLEKQLSVLQSKYQKLQQLCKLEKSKNTFRTTKNRETFVPQNQVDQREEELCGIIQQLRNRLLTTTKELKTLQQKMNEGENYVDQLRRKLRRVEQLQFKIEKMTEQAENDRGFIEVLKDKNRKLDDQIRDLQREKKMLEIQVHRLNLGDSTNKDCLTELESIRKEKEVLQRNLRELTSNLMTKVRNNYKDTNKIEDSGQLLRP